MIAPDDVREAIGRILDDKPSRGDGRLLRLWLRNRLMRTSNSGEKSGALRFLDGQRSLCSEILGLWQQTDDRTDTNSDERDESDLRRGIVSGGKPERQRGVRRRDVGSISSPSIDDQQA